MKKNEILWHPCEMIHGCYIRNDGVLHHGRENLLITYRTPNGKKYVTLVSVQNGRILRAIGDEVIAWAYPPEPYGEETEG